MVQGKIIWFNESKDFGFIEHEDGEEVFCHFSANAGVDFKSLQVGQCVSFEILKGPKGLLAANVTKF